MIPFGQNFPVGFSNPTHILLLNMGGASDIRRILQNKTHIYNIKFISKKYYTSSTILENHNLIKYLIIIEHFRFHKTCLHALVTTARSSSMYIFIYLLFFKYILYLLRDNRY